MATKRRLLTALISICLVTPYETFANTPNKDKETIDYVNLNIREYRAKNLPFSEVLSTDKGSGEKVLFDQGYRGRICLISCHFYDGITSKWGGHYLDLQPYESTCSAIAGGCNTITFPRPDSKIKVTVGDQEFEITMIDETRYRYYLPLALRRIISSNQTAPVTIKTSWDKFRDYKLGNKSRSLLGAVLDAKSEIDIAAPSATKAPNIEARLEELKQLKKKGLIDENEYVQLRKKILELP